MHEKYIRCNKPTPYDIQSPITDRLYYIDGSGQLCEQCFSQLHPTEASTPATSPVSSAPSNIPVPGDQENTAGEENIKTIKIEKGRTPTEQDQELYNSIINKSALTDADREELARLYNKYMV